MHISQKKTHTLPTALPGALRGACAPGVAMRATRLASPLTVPATDAGPLINAVMYVT